MWPKESVFEVKGVNRTSIDMEKISEKPLAEGYGSMRMKTA